MSVVLTFATRRFLPPRLLRPRLLQMTERVDVAQFSLSTEQRYSSHEPVFVGPYRYTRAVLDYSWYAHYSPARQHVQDNIIDLFLYLGARSERPWIVYTAGAMGAGKSYVMRWLYKTGQFPLDKFVWVDPDKIKDCMPDMADYLKHNQPGAGTLTHKESSFIAEIIEREAMQQSKCILVDGSLRNANWYAKHFARIRADFPHYRIAILSVVADREKVYERSRKRAITTGREVPKHVLDDALEKVPESVEILSPLVDWTAVIENNDETQGPRILPPASWEEFRARWEEVASSPSVKCDFGTGPDGAKMDTAMLLEILQKNPHAALSLVRVRTPEGQHQQLQHQEQVVKGQDRQDQQQNVEEEEVEGEEKDVDEPSVTATGAPAPSHPPPPPAPSSSSPSTSSSSS
jgi:hypothetical protein